MEISFWITPALFTLLAFNAAYGRQQSGTNVSTEPEAQRSETGSAPALQQRFPRYRVRAGDVLDLNFPFTPEFNQTITVQPDGYINLRGVDSIRVEGQTLPEVNDSLRSVYAKIL